MLNQPIGKISISQIGSFPQKSGLQIPKMFELPPPIYYLPETDIDIAPENGWLEDDPASYGWNHQPAGNFGLQK